MTLHCKSCGSTRVIPRARLASRSFMLGRPDVTAEIPRPSLIKGPAAIAVSAEVCVDCGHLELRAANLELLKRVHEAMTREGLHLSTATEP